MEINHRTLAPLHCASTDETRYSINSLHFAADGSVVGTDGHVLARYVPSDIATRPSAESPEPFAIERGPWLAELVKEQKRKTAPAAVLDIAETNGNGHARISDANGARKLQKITVDYPDWKACIPTTTPSHYVVALNLAILEKLVAAARQFTETKRGEQKAVLFSFAADEQATYASTREEYQKPVPQMAVASVEDIGSGDRLEFVLMPMRQ